MRNNLLKYFYCQYTEDACQSECTGMTRSVLFDLKGTVSMNFL